MYLRMGFVITRKGEKMDDLISRQVAIDALSTPHGILYPIRTVEELPSAQPEIIRCKDCKHRMPYDWMFSEVWQSQSMDDYPDNEIGCQHCDMSMTADDFCSRAERRTDG